jgi:hypothetical protein
MQKLSNAYFKILLSVDPGWETGLAIFREQELICTSSIHYSVLTTQKISTLITSFNIDAIVIEALPISADVLTQKISNYFTFVAEQQKIPIKIIMPGAWKPIAGKLPVSIGKHIPDAIRMGLYALKYALPLFAGKE